MRDLLLREHFIPSTVILVANPWHEEVTGPRVEPAVAILLNGHALK